MRLLLFFLFFLNVSFSQDVVLVCQGPDAYAYHKNYCRGLQQCGYSVVKMSVPEAVKRGRKPCGNCYKSRATTVYPVAGGYKPAAVSSGQCAATTQKGTRCSRAAKYSGYCWQHK